ncbi:MAG TPA: DUF1638 domain-containing protein [Candidatus Hydrogenedentes bacterium]|nr:DUF1638 domain-containing protein [Candidatus Hydrogenedentota bacterium]HOL77793.1 DUF1638 domain-containing protein [Candidatus Hydrogenedentota bacterium]HPO87092.1 DUF1638 domain-containing protein [Candidatus Hydrogenedentota bacterium]
MSCDTPLPLKRRWFHVVSCHVLWRELCYFAALSKNVFTFHFLKQGLHNTPEILRKELQHAIDIAPTECSHILVGYGLCSNGVEGITARDKPLVIMRGHDCITFLLGSKERYREYFDAHPGTYWYSPGWIDTNLQPGKDRFEAAKKHYIETYGEENAKYLLQTEQAWMQKYSNAAYVDLGFGDTAHYKSYTKQCAEWLHWNCDILEGDPRLVIDFVEGNWRDEDVLVVPPGETITASHDECILAKKSWDGMTTCCGKHFPRT